MLGDINPLKDAATVIDSAERVIPLVEATEKTRRQEMDKLIAQVESSLPDIGPYANTVGDGEGKFIIFRTTINTNEREGKEGEEKSAVIATHDGFTLYTRTEKTDDLKDFEKWPELVARQENSKYGTDEHSQRCLFFGEKRNNKVVLSPTVDSQLITNAIQSSIEHAQKGPKQTI